MTTKDIDVTAELRFTITADQDREDEYNDKLNLIVSGVEEYLNGQSINAEVEVICEEGTQDLYL